MSLITRIAKFFRRDELSTGLRNRPGRMAWIQGAPGRVKDTGESQLNGRAVQCVKVIGGTKWEIDPPQDFVSTESVFYTDIRVFVMQGQTLTVTAIADSLLEPWKDDGVSDAEVRELFAPRQPVKEPA